MIASVFWSRSVSRVFSQLNFISSCIIGNNKSLGMCTLLLSGPKYSALQVLSNTQNCSACCISKRDGETFKVHFLINMVIFLFFDEGEAFHSNV